MKDCTNQTPPRVSGLWLVAVLLVGAVMAVYGNWCFVAPQPLTNTESQFQLANARQHLQELCGNGLPHPPGTQEHLRVQQYIVKSLSDLGYKVDIESTATQRVWDQNLPLQNIVAIRSEPANSQGASDSIDESSAETSHRKKLLFVCHYDSHPAGPGAGDDGAAVASLLEVARIEASQTIGKRDIVFLFTDGEEAGLLGAKAWIRTCPWLDSIDLVFNFEGRGSRGPVFLFETTPDNENLIRDFAEIAPRPVGNSLAREVYRFMPNGTDFTVFLKDQSSVKKNVPATVHLPRQIGKTVLQPDAKNESDQWKKNLQGLNFAFVGGVENYHTKNDRPENLDLRTLMHHGQTAEALLNYYRNAPVPSSSSGRNAVCFDIAGRWFVWWPEYWNWFGFLGCFVLFTASVVCCRIGSLRDIIFGAIACVILSVTMMLLIWITAIGFEQKHWFEPFWGRAIPGMEFGGALVAFWCMAIVGWSTSGCLIECITKDKSLWVSVWGFWLMLCLIVVVFVPGASFLFLIPMSAACVFRLVGHLLASGASSSPSTELPADAPTDVRGKRPLTGWQAEHPLFTVLLPCLGTWAIWFPVQRALLAALAYRIPLLYVVVVPLLLTPTIPLVTVASFRSKLVLNGVALFGFAIVIAFLFASSGR